MREVLTGVQHIGLPTKTFADSCEFYRMLGFEPVYETRQPNGGKVAFYQLGNLQMEIYEADNIADRDGAVDHVSLDCTDIDKAYGEISAMGLPVVSDGIEQLDYWDRGIRFFHVRGPAGEKIEICQKL